MALLCLGTLALVSLDGCRVNFMTQKPHPSRGGTVTEALVGSPGVLNPLFAQEDNARDIDTLIYQGLTRIGAGQQPEPALASTWTLGDGDRSYTFTLRSGVRWADGAPFTADDVMFTFSILQNPAYDQPLASYWRTVRISKWGTNQVKFTLRAPSASFLSALTVGIIAKHLFSNASPDAVAADAHSTAHALGTGPFRVDSISNDHRLVKLVRNRYAQPAAHLDGFVFRSYPTLADAAQAFSTGLVDAVGGVQPTELHDLSRRPDAHIYSAHTFTLVGALFNVSADTAAYFDPPSVRQALVEAVNRRKIVDDVLHGQAQVDFGPIPPSDWAYSPAAVKYHYSPQDAARLLDAAGWTLAPGAHVRTRYGKPFTVSLIAVDSYPYDDVATAVASQLKAVGVDAQVQTVPAAVLVERYLLGRHYQMLLAAFDNGADPDQYTLWHSDSSNPTLSFTRLPSQALIDKDLEDGRALTTKQARLNVYADFQSLMADAAPAIFLYEPYYLYAVSSRIQGVHLDGVIEPPDRFAHVTDWYVPAQAI